MSLMRTALSLLLLVLVAGVSGAWAQDPTEPLLGEVVDFSWENVGSASGLRVTIDGWPTLPQLLDLKNGTTQTLIFRVSYDPEVYHSALGVMAANSYQPVPCDPVDCVRELQWLCYFLSEGPSPYNPTILGPDYCQLTQQHSQDQTKCSCLCNDQNPGRARHTCMGHTP